MLRIRLGSEHVSLYPALADDIRPYSSSVRIRRRVVIESDDSAWRNVGIAPYGNGAIFGCGSSIPAACALALREAPLRKFCKCADSPI